MVYGSKLKDIMHSKGFTLTHVNDILNKLNGTNTTVQNLSKRICNESLKYTEVLQIMDIIGYKICWTPLDEVCCKKNNSLSFACYVSNYNQEYGEELSSW